MSNKSLTRRLSIRELEKNENKQKLNDFLKAWKIIQDLPHTNPNSFWFIATYHGMPFKEREVEPLDPKEEEYWGGYCQHSNVLFPTWHRFYCLRLEQALQAAVPDGDGVALHYWDETSEETLSHGIPNILLQEKVTIDGEEVPNPLLNFELPEPIPGSADSFYVKKAGYRTTRYPLSGITNPEDALKIAEAHNEKIDGMDAKPENLLQENVLYWMKIGRHPKPDTMPNNSVSEEFNQCLMTPDYNAFSNTTSASRGRQVAMTLEQGHNSVHLMTGGFSTPDINPDGSVKVDDKGNPEYKYYGLLKGANGDMGANEVASFDPIFFLHHSNIDRMFWIWQKKWGYTSGFEIVDEGDGKDSGTSAAAQGMTPNQTPRQSLGLDTILYPFQNELGVPRTSKDCFNIEEQLGYTYSIGSLDKVKWPEIKRKGEQMISADIFSVKEMVTKLTEAVESNPDVPVQAHFYMENPEDLEADDPREIIIDNRILKRNNYIKVENVEKDLVPGSFVVQAFLRRDGKLFFLGQRAVLDRWERANCANCRARPKAAVAFQVNGVVKNRSEVQNNVEIHIASKDPATGDVRTDIIAMGLVPQRPTAAGAPGAPDVPKVSFVTNYREQIDA